MSNAIVKRGRGRPSIFSDKVKLVNALYFPGEISYPTVQRLVAKGLLAAETVPSEARGRPAHKYVITGKARSLLALSQYRDAAKEVNKLAKEVNKLEDVAA